ncbi:MAG: hypothetical protein AAFO57_12150, partial [Pseudomonadota bacterium]
LQDAFAAGKFSTTLEDADRQVIPTEWILKAQERWMLRKVEIETKPMTALGVDVASGGADRMTCVPLHGVVFDRYREKPGREVRQASEKFAFVMENAKDDPQFNVDNNGYGDDLCSALESNNFNVKRIKGSFGSTAFAKDGREFENKRAELVWKFRESLHPENGDNIALPPGRELVMELTAFREKPREDMRKVIRIESNDEIKSRIGRSPDIAWAHFFAWAEPDKMAREQRKTHVRRRRASQSRTSVHGPSSNALGRQRR